MSGAKKSDTGKDGKDEKDEPPLNEFMDTVFENMETPAVAKMKHRMNWKEGYEPGAKPLIEFPKHENFDFLVNDPDYRGAGKLVSQARRFETLERLLSIDENSQIRHHLSRLGSNWRKEPMGKDIAELFIRAMTTLHTRLSKDDADFTINWDEESKNLVADAKKAQIVLLDTILSVPNYVPNIWGGHAIGDKLSSNADLANAKATEALTFDPKQAPPSPSPKVETSIAQAVLSPKAEKLDDPKKKEKPLKKKSEVMMITKSEKEIANVVERRPSKAALETMGDKKKSAKESTEKDSKESKASKSNEKSKNEDKSKNRVLGAMRKLSDIALQKAKKTMAI